MSNLKDDVDNLLREVVGDYKNDKKTKKNLNEEDQNDEEVLLSQKSIQIVMCLIQNNLCTISYRLIV